MQPATQRAVLWLLPLMILRISAVPTNRTVDDADPLVQYFESGIDCHGCSGTAYGLDDTQLVNHTVSVVIAPNLASARPAVQISFTGTAIYIFFAYSWGGGLNVSGTRVGPPQFQRCQFLLDGVHVGEYSKSEGFAEYNIPAYANATIPNGVHTFALQPTTDSSIPVLFDYAIYTVDTEVPSFSGSTSPVSSSTSAVSSSTSAVSSFTSPVSSSTSPLTGTSSSGTPGPESNPSSGKNKAPIAAGIAGGIVVLLAIAAGLSLWQRARRRNVERTSALEKADPPGGTLAPIEQANQEATSLAEELRVVKEQLHRLAERVDGSSIVASDADTTVLLRPSLSTMKRDQTRSIRDQRPGSVAHDALVHTDSGLRLTAGSGILVDELPPNYAAE
ncbi:hypothetical protein MVEN_02545200 [Mycena venus]|uniref:Uncharacterized protein n=1 Tax=Mycena venus TaxID=2733690 RepID=A0A8H6U441_9AGAR|nr:hypothetical protein MVEN_02545200 [Mycena venus]